MMRRLRWATSGLLLAVTAMALGGCTNNLPRADPYSPGTYYDGAPIPQFTSMDAENLAGDLAEAEERHGMCFGWSLQDGATGDVQYGSSRGPGIGANTCDSYASVELTVAYTSESSESYDGAAIDVVGSPDISGVYELSQSDFDRLGITREVMVDDPVAATGHAALALPLLLIETGDLDPVSDAAPGVDESATTDPMPAATSSDLSVTRVLPIVLFGLGAIGAVAAGVVVSRRQRAQRDDSPNP